jgi:hypothetical protein
LRVVSGSSETNASCKPADELVSSGESDNASCKPVDELLSSNESGKSALASRASFPSTTCELPTGIDAVVLLFNVEFVPPERFVPVPLLREVVVAVCSVPLAVSNVAVCEELVISPVAGSLVKDADVVGNSKG